MNFSLNGTFFLKVLLHRLVADKWDLVCDNVFIWVFFSLVMFSPFCFFLVRFAKMSWLHSITISWIH